MQLEDYLKEYPDSRLIVIDTLQKVREVSGDKFSYASDYEIVTKLKAFSDEHSICLLVVHHTRKMESSDSFDMISGTNGLLGAADGAFVMQKESPNLLPSIQGLRIFIISWRSRMKPFIIGSNSLQVLRRRLPEQRVYSRENSARSCRNRRSSYNRR